MTSDSPSNEHFAKISDSIKLKTDRGQIDVPMLPEVAGKVVRLTQDPESDAADLAKLIQSDQTLAGHVMRVANSAAYSPNSSLVSLQQAITRLGMKLISEIALAASINSTLFNTPGYDAHIQYELKYSLASGLWAKEIARACRRNVEAAFLGGLLHDIGVPVTVQTALEAAKDFGTSVDEEDMLRLEDLYQRAIGMRVVEQWEMPTAVCHVLKYFDRFEEAHASQSQTMIVVAGTKFASHFMSEKEEIGKLSKEELVAEPVLAELNLYPDDIEKLLEKQDLVTSAMEAMTS